MINWTTKKVKVSDLKEYKNNPRYFTEKGMEELKKSISKFGLAEPLCCNPDLTIIGGHARKKTLIELGIKEVNISIPNRKLSEKEIKELNIRLNKNIAGEWDFDILSKDFELPKLLDWGFEEIELESLGIQVIDDVPDSIKKNQIDLNEFKKLRQEGRDKVIDKSDTEKYIIIVFPNRAERERCLLKLGFSKDERYLSSSSVQINSTGKVIKSNNKVASKNKAGATG